MMDEFNFNEISSIDEGVTVENDSSSASRFSIFPSSELLDDTSYPATPVSNRSRNDEQPTSATTNSGIRTSLSEELHALDQLERDLASDLQNLSIIDGLSKSW